MWSRTIDHLFCGLFAPIQDQYSIPKQDSIPVGCILPLGNRTCFGDHHFMSVLCSGEGGRGQGVGPQLKKSPVMTTRCQDVVAVGSLDVRGRGIGEWEGYRRMGGVGTQSDMWAGGWVLRSDV